MSEERELPPDVQFLLHTRDLVVEGKSAYGPADSPRAKAQLAELDARLAFAERQGRYTPEPAWTADRVAAEQLAREYPHGAPTLEISDDHAAFYSAQLDKLDELAPAQLAQMRDAVAADLGERASIASAPYSFDPETKTRKTAGYEILTAMLSDAETVVRANIEDPADVAAYMKLLAADRSLLENFALRAQHVGGYEARRAAFGIKP
jgi:hypothetical protein